LQAPPLGAAEGSFFARMPWLVTFAGPLVLVAGGLFGHGVRERSPAYVFGAGLVVNLIASLVVRDYHPYALAESWVEWLLANVIVGASIAMGWLGLRKRLYGHGEVGLGSTPLLAVQAMGPLLGMAALLAVPLARLVLSPGIPLPSELWPVSEGGGWLA